MTNLKLLTKTAESGKIWDIEAKFSDFEFSQGYGNYYILDDTKEEVLRSFQPKLMSNLKLLTENCKNKLKSAKKWKNLGHRGKSL